MSYLEPPPGGSFLSSQYEYQAIFPRSIAEPVT